MSAFDLLPDRASCSDKTDVYDLNSIDSTTTEQVQESPEASYHAGFFMPAILSSIKVLFYGYIDWMLRI